MDEVVVPSRAEQGPLFQQMMSQYGGPAFLRRAQQVQGALAHLREGLAKARRDALEMVRLRLGIVAARAGNWTALSDLVDAPTLAYLQALEAELQPQLRTAHPPTTRPAVLHAALVELNDSIARFNRRWEEVLARTDLTEVNRLRDAYNRYYLLEKECAVGSPRIARQGFVPLAPITRGELQADFPPLPMLVVR